MARHRHPIKAGQCQVCRHKDRLRIEATRLAGCSLEATAAKFGVHRDALWRHMAKHVDEDRRSMLMADVPLKDLAEKAAAEGTSLLENLGIVRMTTMHQMALAAAAGDRNATANLARASTEVLREIGKVTGEILNSSPVSHVTHNTAIFMASPAYTSLEAMLVRRLAPHPQALASVLDGLAELQTSPTPSDGEHDGLSAHQMREVIDARAA